MNSGILSISWMRVRHISLTVTLTSYTTTRVYSQYFTLSTESSFYALTYVFPVAFAERIFISLTLEFVHEVVHTVVAVMFQRHFRTASISELKCLLSDCNVNLE